MGLCPVVWLVGEGDGCLKQCPAFLGRGRGPEIAYENEQGKKAEKSLWWAGKHELGLLDLGQRPERFPREMGWGRHD